MLVIIREELLKRVIKKNHLDPNSIMYKGVAFYQDHNITFLYVITPEELVLSDGKKINKKINLDLISEISIKQIDDLTYEVFICDKQKQIQERFILLDFEEFDKFFEEFKKSDFE